MHTDNEPSLSFSGSEMYVTYNRGHRRMQWVIWPDMDSKDFLETLQDILDAVGPQAVVNPLVNIPPLGPVVHVPVVDTIAPGKPKWDDDDLPLM